MNHGIKKRIGRGVLIAAGIYILGGVLLYFTQDRILFHPVPLNRDHPFSFKEPFTELNIPIGNNNLSIVQFKNEGPRRGIVLFFHGNMQNVEHYNQYPSLFLRNGYEVWMMDYPGFGKSTGKRTERLIDEEALLLYELALKETGSDHIVIYGKSIGTGVACYLAAQRNCRQLILETPYCSISDLAKHYVPFYPVSYLLRYSFPNDEYLKTVTVPVSIFHGTGDEVVPYRQGKKLAAQNPGVELITIEKGGHNNLYDFKLFQEKMDSLLSSGKMIN